MQIIKQYSPWSKAGIPCWYSIIEDNGKKFELKLYQTDAPTLEQLSAIVASFPADPTPDEIENKFKEYLKSEVTTRPAFALNLVTYIANYYRAELGKAELTETQVRNRLVA